jgi:hypothetical protein
MFTSIRQKSDVKSDLFRVIYIKNQQISQILNSYPARGSKLKAQSGSQIGWLILSADFAD